MERITAYAKVLLLIAWAVLPLAIAWQVVYGPSHLRGYLDQKLQPAEKWIAGTGKKVDGILGSTQSYIDDNYEQTRNTTKATAAAVHHLDDFIVDLNANVNGGEDTQGITKAGLINDAHIMLVSAQGTITSAQKDLHELMQTTGGALKDLDVVFQRVAALTATLDQEIKEESPKAAKTMESLNQALVDLDRLLADPNIKSTLVNVNKTTYHLGESAESVDIAFRSLRQKFGLIKTILSKAFNVVKVTIPIP